MPTTHRSTTIATALATTALAPAAWGCTYVVTTELLPPGRPLLAAVLRALPAGLVLTAVGRALPRGRWWGKALLLGALNIGGFFALLFAAAYRLPGGVAATLGATQPLVAALLASVVLGERLRARVIGSGLLGLVGVALLVLRADARLDAAGVLAGTAAALSMATGVVLTKRWGRPVPLLAFTGWQLVAGGLLLAPLTLAVEGPPPHLTDRNLAGFLWLATGGTAVAYALWFRGLERLPVARVSLLGLVSPIVATAAGWVVLDQALTATQAGGALLVAAALVTGQRTPAPRPHVRRPLPAPPRLPVLNRPPTTIGGTMSFTPEAPQHRVAPERIAPDTWLIHQVQEALGEPLHVYLNSMVITGAEPLIIDTGTIANRHQLLDDVFGIVDPADVRWIFISHDDIDHTGNLGEVLERCTNATLVGTWSMVERNANAFRFPLDRMRWVGDGEWFDAGDRRFRAVRPPVWDSPTTRGLLDERTGVYWAVDSFATPMPGEPVATVDDLDPQQWAAGIEMFSHHAVAPWLALADPARFAAHLQRIQDLGMTTIATAHSPLIPAHRIAEAFRIARGLPTATVPPAPGQDVLDEIVAATAQAA